MKPLRAFLLSLFAGLAVLFSGYGAVASDQAEIVGADGRRSISMA
jgi:hypothetical protein